MLARMEPIDLETLRRMARLAGFAWSDAELEAVRPTLERTFDMLRQLDSLPLAGVEPTTHYRVI
jgi:Asp-tRNA(Asn)/Glu-tRNA(Gln) amidotransferase C subunit